MGVASELWDMDAWELCQTGMLICERSAAATLLSGFAWGGDGGGGVGRAAWDG